MGKVIMSGIVPQLKKPITGIVASDLAVGSTVKLLENGVAVDYLIIHHGKPSSLYDDSCDGLWLLRKDVYGNTQWGTGYNYPGSAIHSYMNQTFFPVLDADTQAAVKEVVLPHAAYNGTVFSGANGVTTKAFALSLFELNKTTDNSGNKYTQDGAPLALFAESTSQMAANEWWWTRTLGKSTGGGSACLVKGSNSLWLYQTSGSSYSYGARPALILPSTAVFDEDTLLFKGVA